jgi:glycosyltransferase involved in cell wall biosynthesis
VRILFIIPYAPNLIRTRPFNFIRFLNERGHSITLLTLWSDGDEYQSLKALRPYVDELFAFRISRLRSLYNCLSAFPFREPLQSFFSYHPLISQKTSELLSKRNTNHSFAVVHIEHLRGIRYALQLKKMSGGNPVPVVWDSVDSITRLFDQTRKRGSSLFNKLIASFEYDRTRKLEGTATKYFDRTLVTSQLDKDAFLEIIDQKFDYTDTFSVLPNGVDLNYFHLDETKPRESAALVVSGKMSYHANISMVNYIVNDIMPIIWSERPDVNLWIVGKDPPPKIQNFQKNPLIHVTGTVPDIRPYLQSATIAVSPLVYGTGVQNKVLESMACGTPTITTSLAVSALDVKDGRDLLVADQPREFAQKTLSLLSDPQKRKSLGLAGRHYVEKNHRWENIAIQLEGIYHEVILEKH